MKKVNPWIFVALTCLFELLWVYGFNSASKFWHWALVVLVIVTDFYFLTKACQGLPTGTVYAVFAAVGSAGTALMDWLLFKEAFQPLQLFFIAVLIAGVIILKLSDRPQTPGGAL